jgi:hypothetical protein
VYTKIIPQNPRKANNKNLEFSNAEKSTPLDELKSMPML